MNSEFFSTYRKNLLIACHDAIVPKSEPPEVIYHLTDSDALLSIIKSRCLWASLVTILNDSLEVRYGLDIAVHLLQAKTKALATGYYSILLNYLVDPLTVPKELQIELVPFVISFCGRPGKSGQWLHYGRSGHGVAIGFSSSIAETVRYDLLKVDYVPESQKDSFLRLFQAGASAIEAHIERVDKEEQAVIIGMTAHLISLYTRLLAVGMKHPSFVEEDEWRMVAHSLLQNGTDIAKTAESRPTKFRKTGERIAPYEELNFGSGSLGLIKEIILGHASALSVDAIRLLSIESGDRLAISRSEVPVR